MNRSSLPIALALISIGFQALGAQLSDEEAQTILETEWNQISIQLINIGEFQVTSRLPSNSPKGVISSALFRDLQAYNRVGLVSITADKKYEDFKRGQGFSWDNWAQLTMENVESRIIVAKTPVGQRLSQSHHLPQRSDVLLIRQGTFHVSRIVKNEPIAAGLDECRLVLVAYNAVWTPEFVQAEELLGRTLKVNRKARVLFRHDPFQSKWAIVAADPANLDAEFSTDSVSEYMAGDRRYIEYIKTLRLLLEAPDTDDLPPPEADSTNDLGLVETVCREGTAGQFVHGTKCTGFYAVDILSGESVLIDILPQGQTTTKAFSKTKSLVHAGVDIAAPEGSVIYAIADGIVDDVIASSTDEDYESLGYAVFLKHSTTINQKATYSIYSHMKAPPKVVLGQRVGRGSAPLGMVGKTGAAFGSHVHVEVRHFPGRFSPKWRNLYGIEQPKNEATFVEVDFATGWVDPLKVGNNSPTAPVLPSESDSKGQSASVGSRAVSSQEAVLLDPEDVLKNCLTVSTTKGELGATLSFNQDAFDQRYKGRKVRFTGEVERVDQTSGIVMFKPVGGGDNRGTVEAVFLEGGVVRSIKPKSTVAVEGTVSSFRFGKAGVFGVSRVPRVIQLSDAALVR